jgi:hypothetical protein
MRTAESRPHLRSLDQLARVSVGSSAALLLGVDSLATAAVVFMIASSLGCCIGLCP